jgi:serine protease Do
MANRKSSIFYGTLIALSSLVAGIVLASRLDLMPASIAGEVNVPATNSAPLSGPIDATTFRTIAHDAGPSVVSILVTGRVDAPNMEDFFGLQLPPGFQFQQPRNQQNPRRQTPAQPRQRVRRGAGSGFIIDKAGYVLTNNHVVENADEIHVQLWTMRGGEEGLPAKVVGRDPLTDSALLQLTEMPKQPLVAAKFGDSAQLAPGDWVMAIGNPLSYANTVTVGVVSAVDRVSSQLNPVSMRDLPYIQTDAAINQGNSGGPLLNIRGEVVGINTAIASTGMSQGNIGIGFAVPINTIRNILPQLQTGKVTRGRIGVYIGQMSEEDAKALNVTNGGALVSSLEESGPAKAAGIQPGDVIVEFNGKPTKTSNELISVVSATQPGTTVPLKVVRDGKTQTLNIKVAEYNAAAERIAEERAEAAPSQPTDAGFGIMVAPITPRVARMLPAGKGGAVITQVDESSPAVRQVAEGDVILKISGKDVTSLDQVTNALKNVPAGQSVPVLIWSPNENGSGGQERFVLLRKR